MARIGPVVLRIAGDRYIGGARLGALIWDANGATFVTGDRCVLRHHATGDILWQGTYPDILGANFGPSGINVLNGFYLDRIDRGLLMVYLREEI